MERPGDAGLCSPTRGLFFIALKNFVKILIRDRISMIRGGESIPYR